MKPRSRSASVSLLLLLFSIARLASAATCHVDDQQGLLGFKSGITHDPSGILASWKPGTHCCQWNGVTCSDGKRVDKLLLGDDPAVNSYVSGTISTSLSKIRYLSYLYLANLRYISGTFPDVLFRLPRLKQLYLFNNQFSGPLPPDIGNMTQLQELNLGGNRFDGPIPNSISELTRLTYLILNDNLLTGQIPDGIRMLNKLYSFNLAGNLLSGDIPDFFSSFPKLRYINLSGNKLTGTIPASVAALSKNALNFEVGHNALTGQIPSFFKNFIGLVKLDLSWNHFSGTVTKSFGNLTALSELDLSHNNLSDPFPALNNERILQIDLSYNQFHLGAIPEWITKSPSLGSVKLAKCGIKMYLDRWKPENTLFLDEIDLSENEIWGSPGALFNETVFLSDFRASRNLLKFNLGRLGIPKYMKTLELSRNLVYGKVPKEMGRLENLDVSYNHLCGQLPATKFSAKSFVGNDCLCGSPLSSCKV